MSIKKWENLIFYLHYIIFQAYYIGNICLLKKKKKIRRVVVYFIKTIMVNWLATVISSYISYEVIIFIIIIQYIEYKSVLKTV